MSFHGSCELTDHTRALVHLPEDAEPRNLLTQVHPALERVLGPKIHQRAVIDPLIRFGGTQGLAEAGRRELTTTVKPRAPRSYNKLVDAVSPKPLASRRSPFLTPGL